MRKGYGEVEKQPVVHGATALLADCDPSFVAALEEALRHQHLHPERVGEGDAWADVLSRIRPDVVVLSDRLATTTALDALRAIRQLSSLPVVALLERGGVTTELLHFGLGVDDVVWLPASPQVVAARVARIVDRMRTGATERPVLRVGPLEVDCYENVIRVHGRAIAVTPAEFRLLEALAGAAGRAFTRSELIGEAMPESDALERTIDVRIWSLRRKLEDAEAPGLLETVRGVGYRLAWPDGDAFEVTTARSISRDVLRPG